VRTWAIVARLNEMAFRRKAIIDKLRALQPQLKLSMIEREQQRPIAKERNQITAELTAFLGSFCEAIGRNSLSILSSTISAKPPTLLEAAVE